MLIIEKKKGKNEYRLSGLALGKITTIKNLLKKAEENQTITILGSELKQELESQFLSNEKLLMENMFK